MTITMVNRPKLQKVENMRSDPTQRMLFTIGNVNGNAELLLEMIEQIEDCGMLCANDKVVFLGNFISAAGDSAEVIDILRWYQESRPNQVIIIRGEREQKMLCAKKNFFQSELGKGVLRSYLQPIRRHSQTEINFIDTKQFTLDTLWIETLPLYLKTDKYFFVHSGVNPDKDLDKQNLGGFMFIQDPFYKSAKMYNLAIVHTHPGVKVESKPSLGRLSIGQGDGKSLTCFLCSDRRPSAAPHTFGKMYEETLTVEMVAKAS